MARHNRKAKNGKRIARAHPPKRKTSVSKARPRSKARTKIRPKVPRKRFATRKQRAAKVRKRSPRLRKLRADPRAETAVLEMNRGRSLTAAARDSQLSRKQVQDYVTRRRLAKRKGRRWVTNDNRPRRLPVMTGGRFRVLTVRGYEPASLVGEHHHAAGEFVRTNDIKVIKPFKDRTVQAVNGRRYVLETDPNALHRIAAMDSPPFHEIYEIISPI
jgi:hypothetical protein